jgi:hypothetical protein
MNLVHPPGAQARKAQAHKMMLRNVTVNKTFTLVYPILLLLD